MSSKDPCYGSIARGRISREPQGDVWIAHARLAQYNEGRLRPRRPSEGWRDDVRFDAEMRLLEGDVLEFERLQVVRRASGAPREPGEFLRWFDALEAHGPGQGDPLFDWLEKSASLEQMKWFIRQEVAGEAGFEDLAALAQLKLPPRPKLEVARNYWDEMGRGREEGMHGPMLARLADELDLERSAPGEIALESLALANVLLGLALNRRFAYHAIGALGVIELTAPRRARQVYHGLRRLGLSSVGQLYYLLHSTLDVKHSEAWNREAIGPLIEADPTVAPLIAEGALMRLEAGARCFDRYRRELWGDQEMRRVH